MEVQFTDFENAAFAVFIALVSRALLFMGLNFYIPISKVRLAHRSAILSRQTCMCQRSLSLSLHVCWSAVFSRGCGACCDTCCLARAPQPFLNASAALMPHSNLLALGHSTRFVADSSVCQFCLRHHRTFNHAATTANRVVHRLYLNSFGQLLISMHGVLFAG